MAFLKNIFKGAQFGVQGALDQVMAGTMQGVMKGTWGVVNGAFRGVAGMKSAVHSATGIGKVTHGLGYGAGRIIGAPIRPIAAITIGGTAKVAKSIPHDTKALYNLTKKILNSTTTTRNLDEFSEVVPGLFGRRMKRPVAQAIGAGAIGLGIMSGMEDESYNLGLKTAVNGIMDTQGVFTTPGAVSQTYTPVYRNKKINNHGADADLVFAMHNRRNG